MGKTVLVNPVITINSVDLSNHISSVTLDVAYDSVETTAFGQGGHTFIAGLGKNEVSLDLQQDYSASSVNATIWPLVGTTTTVVIHPSGSTSSTVNPSYTMEVLVDDFMPLDGKVGDLSTTSIKWPVNGLVVYATS